MAVDPLSYVLGGSGIAALISAAVGWRQVTAQSKKMDKDAFAAMIESAAGSLVAHLRSEVERQAQDLDSHRERAIGCEQQCRLLSARIDRLERYLIDNGHDPRLINGNS